MIKKLLFALALSAVALPAVAQESNVQSGVLAPVKAVEVRALGREDVRAVRGGAKEKVAAVREEIKIKRDEAKENVAEKRAEMKERLVKVRDEKKRNALQRIEKEFARLNIHITGRLDKALSQIDRVLVRVNERVAKMKDAGRDVSSVALKVDAATAAITKAKDAVKAQAAKAYELAIADEAMLRDDVKALRESLRNDLKAVRDLVKVARAAVHDVAVALAQIPKLEPVKNDAAAPVVPVPVPVN